MNVDGHVAGFRYGVVFVVTLALLVFSIAAPDTTWARAFTIALEGAALTVVVGTSRARAGLRRRRALAVAAAGAAVVAAIAAGLVGDGVVFALAGVLAVAIPATLAGGLTRLIRERGVTLRAVLGALTVYLYVGLLFAWVIAAVSELKSGPYFVQPDVVEGDRVYYSFTVLTTTGFGDLTPATRAGRALAVVEMLLGQLYLVTVIGVLVGGFGRGRRQ
jgi:ion channel